MDIEKLIEVAKGASRLDESVAEEVLKYGISAFLEAGCSYDEALKLIEVATTSKTRAIYQNQFHLRGEGNEA